MGAYSHQNITIMPEEILELIIKEVATLKLNRIEFNWHGGEPLIAEIGFYKKAKQLQLMYLSPNTNVRNCLQTNGTLLTHLCRFCGKNEGKGCFLSKSKILNQ